MMDQIPRCDVVAGGVHVVLGVISSVTAIMVAWLTNRAKKRDNEEKKRNGHSSVER